LLVYRLPTYLLTYLLTCLCLHFTNMSNNARNTSNRMKPLWPRCADHFALGLIFGRKLRSAWNLKTKFFLMLVVWRSVRPIPGCSDRKILYCVPQRSVYHRFHIGIDDLDVCFGRGRDPPEPPTYPPPGSLLGGHRRGFAPDTTRYNFATKVIVRHT